MWYQRLTKNGKEQFREGHLEYSPQIFNGIFYGVDNNTNRKLKSVLFRIIFTCAITTTSVQLIAHFTFASEKSRKVMTSSVDTNVRKWALIDIWQRNRRGKNMNFLYLFNTGTGNYEMVQKTCIWKPTAPAHCIRSEKITCKVNIWGLSNLIHSLCFG